MSHSSGLFSICCTACHLGWTFQNTQALLHRVLIYLEAGALGRPKPAFAAHLTQALLAAAVSLGLRSLEVRHWVIVITISAMLCCTRAASSRPCVAQYGLRLVT